MPKPCSLELRERVVNAVESGASRREAADWFDVSPSSAIKWMQRRQATGSIAPKPSGGSISPLEARAAFLFALIARRQTGRWRPLQRRHCRAAALQSFQGGCYRRLTSIRRHPRGCNRRPQLERWDDRGMRSRRRARGRLRRPRWLVFGRARPFPDAKFDDDVFDHNGDHSIWRIGYVIKQSSSPRANLRTRGCRLLRAR
jgi:transposase